MESRAWQALGRHAASPPRMRELFAQEPGRGARLAAEAAGLYLDYSKQRVSDETLSLLFEFAEEAQVAEQIRAMFAGEPLNSTERRAALHVALRAPEGAHLQVEGEDVVPAVHAVRRRMEAFCEALRGGEWRGHGGERIRHVVNLGIGGSDLGPRMAVRALRPYTSDSLQLHFVSNIDGSDLAGTLRGLRPAETLFVVCSKTFTTLETLTNAGSARAWLLESLGDEAAVARHFVAVSTNLPAVRAFGIDDANVFGFWDWVGGRYSLASAVGLSLMLAVGPGRFGEVLSGMHAMDTHFREAPFPQNLPVLMALLGVWNRNFLGAEALAVLPYDQSLELFPDYLQQLDMESSGKSVSRAGEPLPHASGPVVFGRAGTDGQHAFYQLLHQGSGAVACDFLGFARSHHEMGRHHELLMANCFAQSEALAFGKSAREVAAAGVEAHLVAHRSFPGERPSNTLLAQQLTPHSLGALVALYEHKVFSQGVLWGLNPFDQWGVELGKELATELASELSAKPGSASSHDSSTQALVARYRALRDGGSAPGRAGALAPAPPMKRNGASPNGDTPIPDTEVS